MLASFSASGFANNLLAGLIVSVAELAFIYFFVGWVIKKYERKRWKQTRRLLAYRLLSNTHRIAKHTRWIVAQHHEHPNLMFYQSVNPRLQQLKTALQNFTTESLVHLPALEPGIAENLSKLTTRVSNLEETVLIMERHFGDLQDDIPLFDVEKPDSGWINPGIFKSKRNGKATDTLKYVNLKLTSRGTPSIENYLFLEVTQCIERFLALVDDALSMIDAYRGTWDGGYFEEVGFHGLQRKETAKKKYEEIKEIRDELCERHSQLRENGLHLVFLDVDYSLEDGDFV